MAKTANGSRTVKMAACSHIGKARSGRIIVAGPGCLLVALLGGVGVFWSGLVSLGQAWATPEYSHGPVIPLLSALMLLLEMRGIRPDSPVARDRVPGLWIVLGSLLLGTLGNLAQVPDIVTYALILWIWGMVLTIFGFHRGWVLWPGVLHLVFMLPLPQILHWQLSTWLQDVSSQIGVGVIAWLGVPVYLDGKIIDLGSYKLHVAEACSGLRYLFPIMSFSYVFGVLYTGPRWHKVVLFVAAAPIAVLMNSFRIGMIGLLVDRFGIGQAEGFLHAFEGWIIFLACVLILFGIAVGLQWTRSNPEPLAETLELDFKQVLPQARRLLDIRASRALASAALATVAVALAVHGAPDREGAVPDRAPLALFPGEVGAWQASMPQRLDTQIERVLGADDYLSVSFSNPTETAPVELFVAFYERQADGSGIHSPEVCIPSGGWEVSDWERTLLPITGAAGTSTVTANRAIIQKGLDRQLVLYWFEQRGRRMTNDYAVKASSVWGAFISGRSDGALVRLITSLSPGEDPAAAEERIANFLGAGLAELSRFLPE